MARKQNPKFEVAPAGELRANYGLTAENRPAIKLDPGRVPEPLRNLIPLAEKFGIADDLIRDDVFAMAPKRELAVLRRAVEKYGDLLDTWLAGPEAAGPKFSAEYIAFSAMHMGIDSL